RSGLQQAGIIVGKPIECSRSVAIINRPVHKRERARAQSRQKADCWCRRRTDAGRVKGIFGSDCGRDDVLLGHRFRTELSEEVSAEKDSGRLLEHYARLPSMRDMRRVDIANSAFA